MASSGLDPAFDLQQLFTEAQHRWLTPAEIFHILRNHQECPISENAPNKPPSGSCFLFDKNCTRYYRKDGHIWTKRKDGKTYEEAHMKLKVGGEDALHCHYARGEDNKNFQRRVYWMLDGKFGHIAFVQYLEVKPSDKAVSSPTKTKEGDDTRTESTVHGILAEAAAAAAEATAEAAAAAAKAAAAAEEALEEAFEAVFEAAYEAAHKAALKGAAEAAKGAATEATVADAAAEAAAWVAVGAAHKAAEAAAGVAREAAEAAAKAAGAAAKLKAKAAVPEDGGAKALLVACLAALRGDLEAETVETKAAVEQIMEELEVGKLLEVAEEMEAAGYAAMKALVKALEVPEAMEAAMEAMKKAAKETMVAEEAVRKQWKQRKRLRSLQ